MAETNDSTPEREFDKYSWAPVMERIYSSKDLSEYLRGALIGNAIKQGSNGEGLEGIVAGTMANDEAKQAAIAYTKEQYNSEIKGITLGEYFGHYDETIKKYFGDDELPIADYADMKLDDFYKKLQDLQYKAQNPDKEKAKNAIEELGKYDTVFSALKIINDDYFKEYLPEAIEISNKHLAKQLLMRKKQED